MPHDPRVGYGVAVLFWRGHQILLLKRKGAHAEGHWACPGGWVDFGETAVDAVAREAYEELGVRIHIDGFYTYREETFRKASPGHGIQSLSLYFDVAPLLGQPEPRIMEPEKCDELRWVSPRDPKSWPSPLFPNLESVLEQLAMDLDDIGGAPDL